MSNSDSVWKDREWPREYVLVHVVVMHEFKEANVWFTELQFNSQTIADLSFEGFSSSKFSSLTYNLQRKSILKEISEGDKGMRAKRGYV